MVVQHGLQIECRADRPADLAERLSSSTERVSSAVRACELLEQPHVLDGDHRLVGEGLRGARSAGREKGLGFVPPMTADRADRDALSRSIGHATSPNRWTPAATRPRVSGYSWISGRRQSPRCPRRGSPARSRGVTRSERRRVDSPDRIQRICPAVVRAPPRGAVVCPRSVGRRQNPSPSHSAHARSRRWSSKTGWRSVGELEITAGSRVAVCCSRACH